MAARKKQPKDEAPKEKRPEGRPSLYKPEYAKQAEKLCGMGQTDMELAHFFDVNVRTIYRWQAEHDQFCQALKAGKNLADERVERSLYQKAVGYEQDAVKIFMPAGAAEPVYAKYIEKVAPDTTAGIFWLKNRRPAEWREKVVQEITGKDGGPIQTEEVNARELIASRIAGIASRLSPEKPSGKLN